MYSDSKVKLTLGDSYLPWEFKLFGVEQIIEKFHKVWALSSQPPTILFDYTCDLEGYLQDSLPKLLKDFLPRKMYALNQ